MQVGGSLTQRYAKRAASHEFGRYVRGTDPSSRSRCDRSPTVTSGFLTCDRHKCPLMLASRVSRHRSRGIVARTLLSLLSPVPSTRMSSPDDRAATRRSAMIARDTRVVRGNFDDTCRTCATWSRSCSWRHESETSTAGPSVCATAECGEGNKRHVHFLETRYRVAGRGAGRRRLFQCSRGTAAGRSGARPAASEHGERGAGSSQRRIRRILASSVARSVLRLPATTSD